MVKLGWHCEDCGVFVECGEHEKRFRRWWKETPGFAACTLKQAVSSYCATYPGRMMLLLFELLRSPDDPEENDSPPARRSFLSE